MPLKLVVAALCEISPEHRLESEEVYNWLKRFHKNINELQPFDPGMPPVRDMNRYREWMQTKNYSKPQPYGNYEVFHRYADSHLYQKPQQQMVPPPLFNTQPQHPSQHQWHQQSQYQNQGNPQSQVAQPIQQTYSVISKNQIDAGKQSQQQPAIHYLHHQRTAQPQVEEGSKRQIEVQGVGETSPINRDFLKHID